ERVYDLKDLFVNGGPEPLCKGRLSVNPAITLPGSHRRAFPPAERSVVAVVGRVAAPPKRWEPDSARTLSYLTDAATNIFAPGWDVTYAGGGKRSFYAVYGLGSPYPEDVKLCAYGAGYWAAVAPDASRTFLGEEAPTAIPILDGELGYHARHPKVASGALSESRGWDGEQGPFLEFHDGALVVNFTEIRRADYVANALAGSFRTSPLVDVDAAELIRRIDALRRCLKALPPEGDMVSSTELVLVYAEALSERELRYVFARPEKEEPVSTEDSRRMRKRVGEVYACEITPQDLSFSAVEVGPDGSA
ncbi:MAG: hypothetical protein O7E54_06015, partial [Planctomycetota bacterium]|nr:hypothetical protein [Planctomycetota bacterium]